MKKIITFSLCLMMMVSMSFAAFAAVSVPSQAQRAEADNLDITSNLQGSVDGINSLHADGVRLFDTSGLLSASDADKIEELLDGVSDKTGFDMAIFTTNGYSGLQDDREYADYIYSMSHLGYGDDSTGTILVVNMVDRGVYIYTKGKAIDYITDNQQNYIYDELDGGLLSKLGSGDYAGACAVYAAGILDGFENNDPAATKRGGLSFFKVIIAALVSAVSGILPVNGVKRKYAMQAEKQLAQGFNLAYRANSQMALAAAPAAAALLDKRITRAPIPVVTNNHKGGGHGGGTSTVHTSMGGGVHGGSGRKF